MEEVLQKALRFMEKHQMLLPGERVMVGVSGGADSVCLLFVLLEWRKRHGLELAAVHVNHGIRAEAGEDARFVEELCRRLEVPYYLKEVDVRRFAALEKCSEEEAGRILRYQAFEETAGAFGADKIAVAHNLDDRAETMLFHLFRGSGVRGLAGIQPVRGNIIRPLLCAERSEIEAYLLEKGQTFCRDATNDEDGYTRNRIRHHILPYAEWEIAQGCVRHMGETAELLAETEDYLRQQTQEALANCAEKLPAGESHGGETAQKGYRLDAAAFSAYHPALQKRMLHVLIKELSPGAKDISRVHVDDVLTLFTGEGNRQIYLPFGIRARREYGSIILKRETTDADRGPNLAAGGVLAGISPVFTVLSAEELPRNEENALIFPQNECTKWFDYDKIKEPLVLRTRAAGDYLTIADGKGGMHHKPLKVYMVTEKIPERNRDHIPVLAEGSHVLWLAGYRISEYYKITANTKCVLQVQLIQKQKTEDKNGGAY